MDISTKFLGSIVTAILVPVVLGWLFQSPSQKARTEGGKHWLEYGRVMKGMALVVASIVVLLIGLWFQVAPNDKESVAWMALLFGVLDLPLLIEFYGVRIGYDEKKVYCFSGWRKNRILSWSEIKSCGYSPTNKWWVIETATQGKIRIHEFISGRDSFFAAMRERTGISDARACAR